VHTYKYSSIFLWILQSQYPPNHGLQIETNCKYISTPHPLRPLFIPIPRPEIAEVIFVTSILKKLCGSLLSLSNWDLHSIQKWNHSRFDSKLAIYYSLGSVYHMHIYRRSHHSHTVSGGGNQRFKNRISPCTVLLWELCWKRNWSSADATELPRVRLPLRANKCLLFFDIRCCN